jgi:hypothetical protein
MRRPRSWQWSDYDFTESRTSVLGWPHQVTAPMAMTGMFCRIFYFGVSKFHVALESTQGFIPQFVVSFPSYNLPIIMRFVWQYLALSYLSRGQADRHDLAHGACFLPQVVAADLHSINVHATVGIGCVCCGSVGSSAGKSSCAQLLATRWLHPRPSLLTSSYMTLIVRLQLGHMAISSMSLRSSMLISNLSPQGHG